MVRYKAGEKKRQLIIRVCKRLFYDKGYSATTYSDICEAADIPAGSIAYHFDGKSGIAEAIHTEYELKNMEYISLFVKDDCKPLVMSSIMNLLFWEKVFKDEQIRRFLLEMQENGIAFRSSVPALMNYFEMMDEDEAEPAIALRQALIDESDIVLDKKHLTLMSYAQVGITGALVSLVSKDIEAFNYEEVARFEGELFASQFGITNKRADEDFDQALDIYRSLPIDLRYFRRFAYDRRFLPKKNQS